MKRYPCSQCGKRCQMEGCTVALLAGRPLPFCGMACYEAYIEAGTVADLIDFDREA